MSQEWADRHRRTRRLIRAVAEKLFAQSKLAPKQLYGFCRLTWVTRSFADDNTAYIRSTKIPGLRDLFQTDFTSSRLEDVAAEIADITGSPTISTEVLAHTGITNFYNAYRNSSLTWIENNAQQVESLFRATFGLSSDIEGAALAGRIEKLAGVPKENHPGVVMHPANLLTPVMSSLDPRFRFPLINGNDGVLRLLTHYRVQNASLAEQYAVMVALYGHGGIKDAADLDQAGRDLTDFIDLDGKPATKQFLEEKATVGNDLPLKDENDCESLQNALTITKRRHHNEMTNKLRLGWSRFTLLEGSGKAALFDISVQNFDEKKRNLMIEVKSSVEAAHVRMAVGQLYDYWFTTNGSTEGVIAIVLPEAPTPQTRALLQWLGIGLLWFEENALVTSNDWLAHLAFSR